MVFSGTVHWLVGRQTFIHYCGLHQVCLSSDLMKSTVVDESLSSYQPMYCSREYQASTKKYTLFFMLSLMGDMFHFGMFFVSSLSLLLFQGHGITILKSILMHTKDKIPSKIKQNIVYKWSCPEDICNLSYIGESSRCLEN